MTTELKMTAPEKAVYRALERLGYKDGVDFFPQSKMFGGRQVKGGLVADFRIPKLSLVIRVQGEYFHSRSDAKARDEIQKIYLTSENWTVIDIMASDALKNARFFVSEALRGVSHARRL